MAEKFPELSDDHQSLIAAQQMFFVATAAEHGHVNLSPKGCDSLRILGPRQLIWLNLTGSGNESAAHILRDDRMTLMWCAFAGPPMILRVYGHAQAFHPRDARWAEFAELLPPPLGARQYFLVDIEMVQTSCGFAVPNYTFDGQREALTKWSEKRGADGIRAYWQEKNSVSLDGFVTGIGPE